MKMKYLILGAGPSGLTLANRLKQMRETSFFVLEKEKEAGGLCRSTQVDGSPFDIGGGHCGAAADHVPVTGARRESALVPRRRRLPACR